MCALAIDEADLCELMMPQFPPEMGRAETEASKPWQRATLPDC
jgi:hypothetical protein